MILTAGNFCAQKNNTMPIYYSTDGRCDGGSIAVAILDFGPNRRALHELRCRHPGSRKSYFRD